VKNASRPTIFKWRQTAPAPILCAVRWYLRYSLSLRDVEELLAEPTSSSCGSLRRSFQSCNTSHRTQSDAHRVGLRSEWSVTGIGVGTDCGSLSWRWGYSHATYHHQVLVHRDLTPAQITEARCYQEGDVIRIAGNRAQQRQGLKRDSYVTVEAVNRESKCLVLRSENGRKIEASPVRWKDGDDVAAEVYTPETRTLAKGDRIQIRRPDNRRDIANAEFATITAIGAHKARVRFEGKQPRELTLPLSAMRHVDYGYTVTSFSSQGSTVDKVIVNDDSMRGARLVNREQEYVSVSRARIDARIYTDDAEALRRAVSRDPRKEIALEAIKQQPQLQIQPRQSPSLGINF
jgi:hypothetical protein